mgnify:CR=1 FL=1
MINNIQNKIISLVAPSSAGKDHIQTLLTLKCNYKRLVSYTSRPKRIGEVDGIEYNFVSDEEMKQMIANNQLIEYREYKVASGDTWYYGIAKKTIEEALADNVNYVVIVDFKGLKTLNDYMTSTDRKERLCSVYINTKAQIRLLRSLSREGDMNDLQVNEVIRRFNDDVLNVVGAIDFCDIVVENNNYEDSKRIIERLKGI